MFSCPEACCKEVHKKYAFMKCNSFLNRNKFLESIARWFTSYIMFVSTAKCLVVRAAMYYNDIFIINRYLHKLSLRKFNKSLKYAL